MADADHAPQRMLPNVDNRTIFTADNLDIMRELDDDCIDLIYLDPPFNSQRRYFDPFGYREDLRIGFDDVWRMDAEKQAWLDEIEFIHPGVFGICESAKLPAGVGMQGYLAFMAIRLLEMRRILKPTGSLYLHCDHHASHYLKTMLDAIFGKNNFLNELAWCYSWPRNSRRFYSRTHDTLLFYHKGRQWTFNADSVRQPYSAASEGRDAYAANASQFGDAVILDQRGKLPQDWIVLPPIRPNARERTGWPTQKPLALLELIISASSNPGDIVLDPFCGCATACIASEKLQRRWFGIDIAPEAYQLVIERLRKKEATIAVPGEQDTLSDDDLWGAITHLESVEDAVLGMSATRYEAPPPNEQVKQRLYDRQDGKCNTCGEAMPGKNLTFDHIRPQSMGGRHNIANLQLLCNYCNSLKGSRLSNPEVIAILMERGLLARTT